ncbi:MAG: hypothetical protein FJW39_30860 [Acidobacteria bacterium]|nr:hypothetical protein [Acidobacteriota bacterium]
MGETKRYDLIKRIEAAPLRGGPFDLDTLAGLDVSPQLAAKYVRGGWLERLAQGVYAFPGDTLALQRTIAFLQGRVAGLHVGGKSALAIQGVAHNVAIREQTVLWGDERLSLPRWFLNRFPARYVSANLFDWRDKALARRTIVTPPGMAAGLAVSTPERAVLELLYDVGTYEGIEEAHNVFEGLRNLRVHVVGQLLACCTSVKTVRLFLTWARESKVVEVDTLVRRFELPTGSSRRWMTRLKDGTLLTLKPYG